MTAMTDAGGLYAFSGLAAGNYMVAIALSEEQMAAYVFEMTSMDVTLEDDMTSIVNFEAEHAATASVTVQLFVDEGANGRNDMMDEGEGAFPTEAMLAMVAEMGLPLALPISLAGPGVHDMQSGTAMPDGSVVFAGLKAGQYQVIVSNISAETLAGIAAVAPQLAAALRDFSYGGPATGYPVALTVGQAAMQYAPIDITHTTVSFGVTLKNGETRGAPLPGAMVTLYADAMGETKVGEGMTMVDEETMHAAASIRIARAGTTGNMVYAGVAADSAYTVGEGMQAVMWDPQKTYTMAENANDIVNLNVDLTYGGATITTEYGGGDALAGWAVSVAHGDTMYADTLDADGMAAFKMTVDSAGALPAMYTISVDTVQVDSLHGGEMFEGTSVDYVHTGLALAGTMDAGAIEVKYTTQTLKVYVHREMDQVEGYTGNVLGGDERMSGMIDVDVRYINDAGRSRPFPTTAKIGKSDSKGVVTFTNVPADHRVVAVADEAEQDEEDEDYQSVMLLDPDELAAYDNDDYVMGGAFGPEGGFSHTVELCPLMGPNPSTQDHDECGSFAFVNTYQVSGLVWKVAVTKDKDDGFNKLTDPKFVDGISVSLEPVEGKNLAGDPESATTTKKAVKGPGETSKGTEVLDETHQFDFGAIAAGVYKLSVTDGWRVRTPADDDDLGAHSPKGSTGMVGNAFSPLAGDIALDVTPATGVLYGRVTDSDGLAVDSVTVDVNGQTDMTDEFGRYIVEGFGKRAKGKPIIVKASGEGITEKTDSTSAEIAEFAANAPQLFDFSVEGAADVATISGTVTKSGTGDGVAGVRIQVSGSKLLDLPTSGANKGKLVTDSDGTYTAKVEAVAAGGSVTVTASKTGMSFSPASHTLSAVADSEVSGIDFTAFDHATITGRVLKDGSPVSGVKVEATLVGADKPAASYTTRSTGTFRLSVPFGSYDIAATEANHDFDPPDGGWRITVAPGTTVRFGDITATENDNRVPNITSDADFEVEEGETEIGTVVATDPDDEDDIESFEILTGDDNGADHGAIAIDDITGELTFNSAPDFDEPGDDDEDNVYEVTVQVTSGRGARAKTAEQDIAVEVTSVDEWEVTMVLTPDTISEAGGKSVVTATVKPASPTAFAIEVSVTGTTDERTVEGTTLFFAADAEESTGSVEITAVNNNAHNDDVELTVSGSVVPSSLENFSVKSDKLTIEDDDVAPPQVSLSLRPSRINEGEDGTLRVTLDKALDHPDDTDGTTVAVTVALAVQELDDEGEDAATATPDRGVTLGTLDDQDPPNFTEVTSVTFLTGSTAASEPELVVRAANSAIHEGDLTFRVRATVDVAEVGGQDIGEVSTDSATLTVREDEELASAPQGLAVNRKDAGSITVEWAAASSGGSVNGESTPVTGYWIRSYAADADAATIEAVGWTQAGTDADVRVGTVSGLDANTEYTVEVQTRSAAGEGAVAKVTATTDAS